MPGNEGVKELDRRKHISRTMRWFRLQLGWTRRRLSDEIGMSVASFENGITDNSMVTPCFQSRFGISIEAVAAWRHYALIGTKPPQGAREVIRSFRRKTIEVIRREK